MTDTPAEGGDAGTPEASRSDDPGRHGDERATLDRELDEIELLLGQVRTEAERHETRRQQAAERLELLLAAAPESLREGHEQLIKQTQRAALMSAQIEVLEGKQKVLRRYSDALNERAATDAAGTPDRSAAQPVAGIGQAGNGRAAPARDVLAAQEDLRRLIARQMHDGPAQSIANIALQAQVVQRLLAQDPAAAGRELDELRGMVQHALEATKTFIFEVRPMVLDDLGLLPTLRRTVRERAQGAAIPVGLESHGQDRRLDAEIESNLFRILDDSVSSFLAGHPAAVSVRLDWMEDRVSAIVISEPPRDDGGADELARSAAVKTGADVPPALAGMIAARESEVVEQMAARRRRYALADPVWQALRARADTVDIGLVLSDDGLRLEAAVDMPRASGRG